MCVTEVITGEQISDMKYAEMDLILDSMTATMEIYLMETVAMPLELLNWDIHVLEVLQQMRMHDKRFEEMVLIFLIILVMMVI